MADDTLTTLQQLQGDATPDPKQALRIQAINDYGRKIPDDLAEASEIIRRDYYKNQAYDPFTATDAERLDAGDSLRRHNEFVGKFGTGSLEDRPGARRMENFADDFEGKKIDPKSKIQYQSPTDKDYRMLDQADENDDLAHQFIQRFGKNRLDYDQRDAPPIYGRSRRRSSR